MLVPNVQKGKPIDLIRLAQLSTRPRRPRPTVNIVRPALLTDQLRGCCECAPSSLGLWTLPTSGTGGSGTPGSILGAVATGVNFVPGVGQLASATISIFSTAINAFQSWFGIGSGRREADVIVPVQNSLMNRLDQITPAIDATKNPSVTDLQKYYQELWQLGVGFMEFVLQPVFTDRRASGQALNTVMPYIDGSCGYPVPLGQQIPLAVQRNCIQWGQGTIGGNGSDGMMGSISRGIQAAGGRVPTFPATIISAADTGFQPSTLPPVTGGGILSMGSTSVLAVGLGALALFLYSRR